MSDSTNRVDARTADRRTGRTGDEGWCGDLWSGDRLSSYVWAALFIWAGTVLLAAEAGLLSYLAIESTDTHWAVFFIGAGVIGSVEIIIRLVSDSYHKPEALTYGLVILAFGVASGTLGFIWPIVLVIIGGSILRDALRQRASGGS